MELERFEAAAALRAQTADAGAQGGVLIREQFPVTRYGFDADGRPASASIEMEHHYMLASVAPPADPVREAASDPELAKECETLWAEVNRMRKERAKLVKAVSQLLRVTDRAAISIATSELEAYEAAVKDLRALATPEGDSK
jgi:hypothetical protein